MTFTQVQVNGYVSTLAPQIANTGSAPYNTLVYDTKLKTTADMSNLANYLLTVNSQNTPTPFSLTTDTLCADGIQALLYMTDENSFLPYGTKNYLLGTAVTIEFRGTTVTALLQGISSNFYADRAVVAVGVACVAPHGAGGSFGGFLIPFPAKTPISPPARVISMGLNTPHASASFGLCSTGCTTNRSPNISDPIAMTNEMVNPSATKRMMRAFISSLVRRFSGFIGIVFLVGRLLW